MLLRLGAFAVLMSFVWYLILKAFLLEKAVRVVDLDPDQNHILGRNTIKRPTRVIAIDFTEFGPRDYMTLICFAFFTFYVAEIWKMWMHMFFEPAVVVRLAPRELHDSSDEEI